MKETFEEWLNTIRRSDLFTESERTLLERAWNHQQSKIDELETKLSDDVKAAYRVGEKAGRESQEI